MAEKIVGRMREDPVKQFAVFVENKVGRLLEIIDLIETHNTHVLALTILDTADSSIVRMVFDDPDRARILFQEHTVPFNESDVLVVEMESHKDLHKILSVLLRAEVNIMYTYSFLDRPQGKAAVVMNIDDAEVAIHALDQHNFTILHQTDLAR